MFRVTKGTRVVLMRHAESEWNQERIEALMAGERPPVRLPDKRDAALSPFGRVQAYLAGSFLKNVLGSNGTPAGLDVIIYSSYRRAEETAEQIIQAMGVEPRYLFQTNHLDEAHEWLPIHYHSMKAKRLMRQQASVFNHAPVNGSGHGASLQFGKEVLTSFSDLFQYELQKLATGETQDQPTEEILQAAAKRATNQFAEVDMPRFLLWYRQQIGLTPQARRKTPEWESYEDVKDRAKKIADQLRRYLGNGRQGLRTILIVTHSKISVALRELFEELSDEEVQEILRADGPPFPPHIGMTFYKEENNLLVRDGEPYQLPVELEVRGRKLEVSVCASAKKMREVCRASGVRYSSKRIVPARTIESNAQPMQEQREPFLIFGSTGSGKSSLMRPFTRFSRRSRG